jgi:ABC-type Fe3+ transport system substrate-binding protein
VDGFAMTENVTTVAGGVSLLLMRVFREEMASRLSRPTPPDGKAPVWKEDWNGWEAPDSPRPEVLLSLGYENRFGKGFQARDDHRALDLGALRPAFREISAVDPTGRATMFAGTPYVMLVDRRVLGPLPVPRRWSDLLKDEYRGEIASPGGAGGISSVILLHYHLHHGMDGLERFSRAVRSCSHGSRFAREASEGGVSAAISILPWIFARCVQGVDLETVWPEEGAILSPMWISVREDATPPALELAEFVAGAGLGGRTRGFGCPWASEEAPEILPQGAKLDWCGWDLLHGGDMDAHLDALKERSRRARHASGSGTGKRSGR